MDNGPIARSHVFQRVMAYLGVQIQRHMPESKGKHRHTARAKGKVERAFRTVKGAHEVLYHLRAPKDESEASTLTITDPDMLKIADPPDAQLFMGR